MYRLGLWCGFFFDSRAALTFLNEYWPDIGGEGVVESRAVAKGDGDATAGGTAVGSCGDSVGSSYREADAGTARGTASFTDREPGGCNDRQSHSEVTSTAVCLPEAVGADQSREWHGAGRDERCVR